MVPANQLPDNYPPLPRRPVLEADHQHPMPEHAFPPAGRAVLGGDTPRGDEVRVAGFADVVVAVAACGAVEAGGGGGNRVGADVAGGGEGEGRVGLERAASRFRGRLWWGQEGREGVACGGAVDGLGFRGGGEVEGGVRDGQERVGAAFAGVDAGVAEAPFAVVAAVAFPEAGVGEGGAGAAEEAGLEPGCSIGRRSCMNSWV